MLAWALNEEDNVRPFVERAEALLRALSPDFELVLIDDGSRDRTSAIVRELQQSRPWLRLHVNERNRGSGYNTRCAIGLARREILFWQTVDWSYDLSALPDAARLLDECDALQGFRPGTLSPAGFFRRSDTALKAFISLSNYWLVRLLHRVPARDFQNVSVYRTAFAQALPLEAESAFTNPECLIRAYWRGARIQEFPVPFVKRTRGVAKGTRLRVVLRSLRDVWLYWWRWSVRGGLGERRRGEIRRWPSA
jgi:glycosyltransferase involved in cell wall biosynthesis